MLRARALACLVSASLALATPLPAQETAVEIPKGGISADAPLEINGDRLKVEKGGEIAVFEGNVSLIQGDIELRAARMTARFARDGKGGQRITEAQAEGHVVLERPGLEVRADRARYDVEANEARFSGNVSLVQGPITMQGQDLTLDLASGRAVFAGRVRTVIKGVGGPSAAQAEPAQ